MNAKDQQLPRRGAPTATEPEVRVVIGARQRSEGRLDHALEGELPDDPALADVVAAARAFPVAESWMLAGGEPTVRGDFPQLVRALADAGAPRLGMITDGLALAAPNVAGMLRQLGLGRVRVRLHSARADAHDWLVGQPGAFKRTIKAIRACRDAGLETEIECTLTRPTAPYTEEALDLFVKLGAKAVVLRRVTARGPAGANDVAVMPRFALVGKEIEKAALSGVRHGLTVMIEGLPRCVVPGAAACLLPTDAVAWAVPSSGGWPFLRPRFEAPAAERGCGGCAHDATCPGAPLDYVRRFGRTEIDSETNRTALPPRIEPAPLAGGELMPPPRAGRFPPTRLAYVRLASRLPSLGGDPLVAQVAGARADVVRDTLRLVFLAPSTISDPVVGDVPGPTAPESTRDVRIRLVRAAQHGPATLRIAGGGTLAHPQVADLLREATRLQLPRIEVAGEASGLDAAGDMELRRLRGLTRLDVALFSPDPATHDAIVGRAGAFDAALRVIDRLGALVPSIEVGAYAVLRSHEDVAAFAEAWDAGELPGAPFFRLAPRGGSLVALARAAEALGAGAARDALAAVLPRVLLDRPDHVRPAPEATPAWGEIPDAHRAPSGSDRYGCYTQRLADTDPGHAVGWSAE
jgi:MoaA/NifB/PqqE/SkfB family radical SAM enzyme